MTKKKEKQLLCEDNLRHNEYYGMQSTIDNLYQASANGEVFTDLMSVILQRENIMLAYRNIKKNTGSKTSGTDNLTIEDIGKCTPDEVVEKVRFIVNGSKHGYRPKPVRRKEIPKPYDPSKTRPLGIPCIWDRLVQQCIKQVMEPVCEAKFSNNSYGFRPNHSVENAIARSYQLLQHANLHYVIEFDIKGFFDNVNHAKLIRQIWAMGILLTANTLKLSKASVTSYLPYRKGVYFPSTAEKGKISVGAERQRRYRAMKRWRADPTEEHLWEVVLLYAGVRFKTYSGLPFTYEIRKGRNVQYTKELWIDRRENSKSLAWSSVLLALGHIKKVGEIVERPKALGDIRGVTYIYGMFYRFGLINVPDEAKEKMKKAFGKSF